MESKEAQASGFDVDAVRNGLENLRFELAKFNLSHQGINLGLNAQQSGIKHMHDNMMSLAKHYTTLMSTLYRVQDKIDNKREEIQDLDNQYEVLSKEREQLQREQKELFTEEKFQQINEKLSEGNASMAKNDLEIEQRLRDFTREDLFQRMDAFNNVKERLTNTNVEFRTEWESFKTETREFRQELKPYRDDIDNLNSLIVSRLRGLGMDHQNLTGTERESIDKTVKYYQLEKEFKERQQKFVDSQIILRDLQDEMSGLMTERQALWKQNENLELQIDQLQPEGERTGFLLHHTDRHTDLPHTDSEFQEDYFGADNEEFAEAEVSLGGEENHCGGLMLHRCMKMTNIPLVMNSTQYVDAEAVTTDLFEDEDKDIEQEQEDEERETMSGKTYHDQMADLGSPGDDRDPDDEEDEDEEEGEGEENFTILDSSMQSMLPSGPSGSLGFGPQPGDSEDDDEEGENDGEDGPNDGSGGTNEQQQQQSKAQRYHAMADAPDTPASLISKVRGRLGAASTSSKNLLGSRGVTAGSNPLTKQSSAKFGESTFNATRRGRRK